MNNKDIHNIGNLYEEGLWDRMKAGASSIKGGLTNMKMLGSSGYAKGAQEAKTKSLMNSFISKVIKDIEKFDSDVLNYKQSRNYDTILKKANDMRDIIYKYQK
jgi:hypothetical protein